MRILKMLFRDVYTVKIIYKSGATHLFECTKFNYNQSATGQRQVDWSPYSSRNTPLIIGVDDIVAVWQVGHRKVLVNPFGSDTTGWIWWECIRWLPRARVLYVGNQCVVRECRMLLNGHWSFRFTTALDRRIMVDMNTKYVIQGVFTDFDSFPTRTKWVDLVTVGTLKNAKGLMCEYNKKTTRIVKREMVETVVK